mgnify:CR=1 FL=1
MKKTLFSFFSEEKERALITASSHPFMPMQPLKDNDSNCGQRLMSNPRDFPLISGQFEIFSRRESEFVSKLDEAEIPLTVSIHGNWTDFPMLDQLHLDWH